VIGQLIFSRSCQYRSTGVEVPLSD
jgi:hypothetical protein